MVGHAKPCLPEQPERPSWPYLDFSLPPPQGHKLLSKANPAPTQREGQEPACENILVTVSRGKFSKWYRDSSQRTTPVILPRMKGVG